MMKVSLSVMVLYMLYRVVFSRYTFFVFNRIYLLLAPLISFMIPLVSIPVSGELTGKQAYSLGIDWEGMLPYEPLPVNVQQSSWQPDLFRVLLFTILLISVLQFFLRFRKIFLLRRAYQDGQVHMRDGVRCVVHPEIAGAFTLFRTVYIHPGDYNNGNRAVLHHELVHAQQWHFLDLVIYEIICAFLWFNPFVFLFKRQVRQNHEFLADNLAQAREGGLIPYMVALSGEIEKSVHVAFASNFRSSTFKKRIIMLTDRKTHRSKRYVYMLLLPFIGLLVTAFQQPATGDPGSSGIMLSGMAMHAGNNPEAIADPPSGFPMDKQYRNSITARFGKMKHPFTKEEVMHNGIDIAAPAGVAIYATGDGTVVKSEFHEKYGNLIVIKHDEAYTTLFAHMASRLVEQGDQVQSGQKIATNGTTGLSTGPHLHYEVRKDGENLDPEKLW
jgi:murein DD-endopeptidase MepM/ murein hydrolase activator NlpD